MVCTAESERHFFLRFRFRALGVLYVARSETRVEGLRCPPALLQRPPAAGGRGGLVLLLWVVGDGLWGPDRLPIDVWPRKWCRLRRRLPLFKTGDPSISLLLLFIFLFSFEPSSEVRNPTSLWKTQQLWVLKLLSWCPMDLLWKMRTLKVNLCWFLAANFNIYI